MEAIGIWKVLTAAIPQTQTEVGLLAVVVVAGLAYVLSKTEISFRSRPKDGKGNERKRGKQN